MPKILKTKLWELYIVTETPDDKGIYRLKKSVLESLSRTFPESETDEMLQAALVRLWGGGYDFPIDDDVTLDDDGNLLIEFDPECYLPIPDIRNQIGAAPYWSKHFYVLVDKDFKEFRWVVCVHGDTIYQGQRTDTPDVAVVAEQAAEHIIVTLPREDEVYDRMGFASDADGARYLDPEGNPIKTEDLLRKIKKQDWHA